MTLLHTILPSGETQSWEYEGPLEYRCVPFQAIRRLLDPKDQDQLTIEHVSVLWKGQRAHMFVDEDGLRKELEFNQRAWRIYINASLRREGWHNQLYYNLQDNPCVVPRFDTSVKLRTYLRSLPPIVGPAVLWEGDMT